VDRSVDPSSAEPADGDVEREVASLERALLDPAVRADPARVAALLHPGFVEIGASGRRWDRAAIVAELARDPGDTAEPLRAVDLRAQRLAPDVVLVTYRSEGPGRSAWRSSVWVLDGPTWVLRHHQGTPVPG
jgi:ribonuclease HI